MTENLDAGFLAGSSEAIATITSSIDSAELPGLLADGKFPTQKEQQIMNRDYTLKIQQPAMWIYTEETDTDTTADFLYFPSWTADCKIRA